MQYLHPADAEEAKYHMDGQVFLGRELTVVFAEENRKKPQEMRARERVRYSYYYYYVIIFYVMLYYIIFFWLNERVLTLPTFAFDKA